MARPLERYFGAEFGGGFSRLSRVKETGREPREPREPRELRALREQREPREPGKAKIPNNQQGRPRLIASTILYIDL